MTKQEQIEKMAKIIDDRLIEANLWLGSMNKGKGYWIAEKLIEYYQPKLPSEKIVYGSLITSTKCYNCIHFPLCFAQKGGANLELASENDCCYYQSKLPEDSVVLSKKEYEMLKYGLKNNLE